MVDNKNTKDKPASLSGKTEAKRLASEFKSFSQALKDFALTVGEPCPEGHRRDPRSGACLPVPGGLDHTAETRSLNNEWGPEWRGEREKTDLQFDSQNEMKSSEEKEVALDASEMDEPESCSEGTTFSFVKRACVTLEEAEVEDNEQYAFVEEADQLKVSEEPRMKQPEARRDTPNHECPPNYLFNYGRRKCIPLNKNTVLKDATTDNNEMNIPVMRASQEIAHGYDGVAETGPDPMDGHCHYVTVDADGNGMTSMANGYCSGNVYHHSHKVKGFEVQPWTSEDGEYTSRHFGMINPFDNDDDDDDDMSVGIANPKENLLNDQSPMDPMGDLGDTQVPSGYTNPTNPAGDQGPGTYDDYDRLDTQKQPDPYPYLGVNASILADYPFLAHLEESKKLKHKERKALKDSDFGVPGKRKFPLHDCSHVRNAMARFNQAKGLSSAEKSTLKSKIISRAKSCGIKVDKFAKASTNAEYNEIAVEILQQELNELQELANRSDFVYMAKKSSKRSALPDSAFGVPGKRKFPLDTCGRVRNAMARFNQAKGLSPAEKSTLRRKVMSRAKACGIKVEKFAKATTSAEFAEVYKELIAMEAPIVTKRNVAEEYTAKDEAKKKGPCPPGMEWDPKAKKCGKMMGFFEHITQADQLKTSEEPRMKQPEGRRDTPNHQCPPDHLFDYSRRKCIPLNKNTVLKDASTPADQMGVPVMRGSVEKAQSPIEKPPERVLTPNPKGQPDRLPVDCPKGTIWQEWTKKCLPLDTHMKIASDETADVNMQNREGLTPRIPGKVRSPADCPKNHMWDGKLKVCKPLDPADKIRPGGLDEDPFNFASMSVNRVISELDKVIAAESMRASGSKVSAKDLPNAAFPPSLVSSTKRSLMHHTPEAADAYDHASVDVVRLRNALARFSTVTDFSEKAKEDALEHLLYHAREVLESKKS